MLELDSLTILLLALTGLLAGTVDSIAGGGGLITLPALLATGLPPATALGTNKLQSCFGAFSATRYFYRQGLIDLTRMRLAIIATFFGSAIGTLLVQRIQADRLNQLLPFLLVGFALYFLFSKRVQDQATQARLNDVGFALLIGTSIGFYDGFFGPGTGAFFMLAFVALAGFSATTATAHTKLLNFTSNIAALLFFALGGHVAWQIGFCMAAGQLIGGRIGSALVVRQGARLVRPLLVLVSLVMSVHLFLKAHPHWLGWWSG